MKFTIIDTGISEKGDAMEALGEAELDFNSFDAFESFLSERDFTLINWQAKSIICVQTPMQLIAATSFMFAIGEAYVGSEAEANDLVEQVRKLEQEHG